jgi:hypothetical protein
MIEGRGGAGLLEQALPGDLTLAAYAEKLEGHETFEQQVLRLVHDPHSTPAELVEQPIVGDGTTGPGISIPLVVHASA